MTFLVTFAHLQIILSAVTIMLRLVIGPEVQQLKHRRERERERRYVRKQIIDIRRATCILATLCKQLFQAPKSRGCVKKLSPIANLFCIFRRIDANLSRIFFSSTQKDLLSKGRFSLLVNKAFGACNSGSVMQRSM